jgi:hypothetical protein
MINQNDNQDKIEKEVTDKILIESKNQDKEQHLLITPLILQTFIP